MPTDIDAYVKLADFKNAVSLDHDQTDNDASRALEAASRAIEQASGRRTFAKDDEATDRRYTATGSRLVIIDDAAEIDQVEVDGTVLDAGAWDAEPLNATVDGKPYLWIVTARPLPSTLGAVKVTGKFGWPAVPAQVPQLTVQLAARLLKRGRQAPFGIIQSGLEEAALRIAREDPDMQLLLQGLRRGYPAVA